MPPSLRLPEAFAPGQRHGKAINKGKGRGESPEEAPNPTPPALAPLIGRSSDLLESREGSRAAQPEPRMRVERRRRRRPRWKGSGEETGERRKACRGKGRSAARVGVGGGAHADGEDDLGACTARTDEKDLTSGYPHQNLKAMDETLNDPAETQKVLAHPGVLLPFRPISNDVFSHYPVASDTHCSVRTSTAARGCATTHRSAASSCSSLAAAPPRRLCSPVSGRRQPATLRHCCHRIKKSKRASSWKRWSVKCRFFFGLMERDSLNLSPGCGLRGKKQENARIVPRIREH
ncbi:hypothetical protein OsI_25105 [Oryza sativa Indica Group]|uniref:Uncharacterized protein n=1 Tax=Oryza sativa subsp. indica TaxID=39946 RepID=A2YIQ4_ORYSI|nr:hypothetical protein OsI_25105 [Oryza sativa Indica Group]